MPDRAQRCAVPEAAQPYCPRTATGTYQVAFHITLRPGATSLMAEQWLRATFEDAPRRWRWFLLVGWTAITCRLRPRRSPATVLGWRIEHSSPDVAALVVRAWVGLTSRLVASVEADGVTLSSFVEFSGPTESLARVVWAMTVPLHERVLPHLLRAAARRHARHLADADGSS